MSATLQYLRRLLRSTYERMFFVPLCCVIVGIVAGGGAVRLDRAVPDDWIPDGLRSTVDSAAAVLSTIAGGLIAAITLLLSLTLVAVQLAGSQFSPRTIKNWIGDRTQQFTIGFVLGTTVFCLMVLRETQASQGGSEQVNPDISVMTAVVLMIVALLLVVYSVGHLSNRMQIGSVAQALMLETVDAIRTSQHLPFSAAEFNATAHASIGHAKQLTGDWVERTSPSSGWLVDVDFERLAGEAEHGSQIELVVPVGAFVFQDQVIARIEKPASGSASAPTASNLPAHVVEVGSNRMVENDAAFGILQMSDVAIRALSPGVNDPNTACDIVSYMGVVLLALWEKPICDRWTATDGQTVLLRATSHDDHLRGCYDQILRYGIDDVVVIQSIIDTLRTVRDQIESRELTGATEPIDEMLRRVEAALPGAKFLPDDRDRLVGRLNGHRAA